MSFNDTCKVENDPEREARVLRSKVRTST
jgi:hypothetical protein